MLQKLARLETEETYVPRYFYGVQKFVTLTADVMFVNRLPFLVTLSQSIQLFTVELLPIHTDAQLIIHLTNVFRHYARGGSYIRNILMDQ